MIEISDKAFSALVKDAEWRGVEVIQRCPKGDEPPLLFWVIVSQDLKTALDQDGKLLVFSHSRLAEKYLGTTKVEGSRVIGNTWTNIITRAQQNYDFIVLDVVSNPDNALRIRQPDPS